MAFKRFGNWLLTEKGQNFSLGLATVATVGSFSAHALPNTILLSYYKDIVHLYRNGVTVPLNETLKKRFEKAVELADIAPEERYLYRPFLVYGYEMFNAGSSYSKFGSIIGLPTNFIYNSVQDIDKISIKVKGDSVVWDLPEAKELLDSLVLSEKAQIYGICRELKMLQTPKLLLDASFAICATFITYMAATIGNKRLLLLARPRGVRYTFYTLITALTATNYVFAKDFTSVKYEQKIDAELKARDPILAEGGREFYEKTLQRNVAFRNLMGSEGESRYTVNGNINYLLRQKHVPLVHRKLFFENKETEVL